MKVFGNPFQEETADLLTLGTKKIATPGAGEIVPSHYQTESRFKAFMKFRKFRTSIVYQWN